MKNLHANFNFRSNLSARLNKSALQKGLKAQQNNFCLASLCHLTYGEQNRKNFIQAHVFKVFKSFLKSFLKIFKFKKYIAPVIHTLLLSNLL